MRYKTLAVFAAAILASVAIAADAPALQERIDKLVDNALVARFTITTVFQKMGRLPYENDVLSLPEKSEWTDSLKWTGQSMWIIARQNLRGAGFGIMLTPVVGTGNKLDWTCATLGGGNDFPKDCTAEINTRYSRKYPQTNTAPRPPSNITPASPTTAPPATSITIPSPANTRNVAPVPVGIQDFMQESVFPRHLVSEFVAVNDGKVPGANEIGFPPPASKLVDNLRWNGRELWLVASAKALGAELVLILTPVVDKKQEVTWSCRSMGKVTQVPADCTGLLPAMPGARP